MRLLRLLQGSPSCLVVVSTSRAESLPDNSDLPCGKKERRQPVWETFILEVQDCVNLNLIRNFFLELDCKVLFRAFCVGNAEKAKLQKNRNN